MSDKHPDQFIMPPRWVLILGSIIIVGHLVSVGAAALAAPSGPWPGRDMAAVPSTPPQFAYSIDEQTRPYLQAFKLSHNFHFPSNRPGLPSIYLELKLKDEAGWVVKHMTLPDPNANPMVRRRQTLLAQALGDDQPVMLPTAEVVPAPNQAAPKIVVWDQTGPQQLTLKAVETNLVPRDRPVAKPNDWALIVMRSYARHLCREYGAAKCEIIRHSKDPMPALVLFTTEFQPGMFEELVSNFGEVSK